MKALIPGIFRKASEPHELAELAALGAKTMLAEGGNWHRRLKRLTVPGSARVPKSYSCEVGGHLQN